MRLKKLEILGFKSFAHKTTLEFPVNISAIVGPNGSGKSNVVDSVRWVLGEQSFKNLRSKSGVDLIWAGSAVKSAQGKAGVSLYFDNHDGFFPIDFEEVIIGRKVYRDGANEYYLNNSQVRLKDITELLARSKLGLRGHSIVNQGSADEILKADPLERRGILEEALGLREFQLKKSEAEAKLLETSVNLEQTANLINEIFPHLRSLKRQVEKFKKREFLINDLNNLENEFFKIKIQEILAERSENQKAREEINAKIAKSKENFEAKQKLFEGQLAKISQTGKESGQLEIDSEKLNVEQYNVMRELGRIEGLIESAKKHNVKNVKTLEAVLAIKIKYWAKRLNVASELVDADAVKKAVKNLAGEIETISNYFERNEISKILSLMDLPDLEEENRSPYEKDKEDLKIKLAKLEDQIKQAKETVLKIRLEETKWRDKYLDFQKELEVARREYISAQEVMQKFDLEEEKIKLREADIKSEMWSSGKNYEEFQTPIVALAELAPLETKFLTGLEDKIIKLRRGIADIGSIDEETMREYEETNKRHEFLTTESTDLNHATESLRNLIRDLTGRINNDFKMGLIKINEEFNHYFRLMFGGGSASLKAGLPVEALPGLRSRSSFGGVDAEAGVSVNVNMPQKRVKDLTLLSGGERSLVSIALLFAIVSASRPPFLILDEIDAALDENNAVRFAKVLKDLAEKTQFILITHNRATMEIANVLYGVTMSDDGVSKLFSLKLEDAVV
ncbi:MAG: AAA family ATPase [Candidatus Azambacteria bacterium]|nr:AAA family ATPase [Candidatus Azambacteria bacterium]